MIQHCTYQYGAQTTVHFNTMLTLSKFVNTRHDNYKNTPEKSGRGGREPLLYDT